MPLRGVSARLAFGFDPQQLEEQGVHILRGLSGLDQVIPEVVDPCDRQPVLKSSRYK